LSEVNRVNTLRFDIVTMHSNFFIFAVGVALPAGENPASIYIAMQLQIFTDWTNRKYIAK
jgi:hypothetical protein